MPRFASFTMPDGSRVRALSEQAARAWWADQQRRDRPGTELHEVGEARVHLTDWLRQAFGLQEGDVRLWRCSHGESIAAPRAWIKKRLIFCDASHIYQSGAVSGHLWSGEHSRDGLSFAEQAAEWTRQHAEATGAAGRR